MSLWNLTGRPNPEAEMNKNTSHNSLSIIQFFQVTPQLQVTATVKIITTEFNKTFDKKLLFKLFINYNAKLCVKIKSFQCLK